MSEIKKEIKENADGTYTITDEHTIADIVRWLLTQGADKQEILGVFEETASKRKWVGLTDDEIDKAWRSCDYTVPWEQHRIDIARAIEVKLKEKNHG